jgi:hypothetical protein
VAISRMLGSRAARVLGVRDGLLFREWLPPATSLAKLPATRHHELAKDIAIHIADRARALRLPTDPIPALAGRGTVADAARRLLARPLRDRTIGCLLEVRQPGVLDGTTGLEQWHLCGADPVKVARVPGPVSRILCCDPVYDLVGVAALADDPELENSLRAAFADAAGEPVDDERWLLYLLVQQSDAHRRGLAHRGQIERLSSLAVRRYLARRVLGDAQCPTDGPLCALKLDGVLEHANLGWPSPTPASVLAMRSLMIHGFRPVVVSDHSVTQVRDLCVTFGMPGGVAEYGAVVYEPGDEQVMDLVRPAASERVRLALTSRPGVAVDPDYRVVVRATALARAGRRPLHRAVVEDLMAAHPGFSAIPGDRHTDFVAAEVDQGKGLAALARLLGHGPAGDGPAPIAAAVGNSAADLRMLDVAQRPFLLGPSRRRGLVQIVSRLVGHAPGSCPRCAPPPVDRRGRQMLAILTSAGSGIRPPAR